MARWPPLKLSVSKKREIIQSDSPPEFTPPVIEETNWQAVKKYLIGKRKLPSGLVDSWHNSGLIYADEKPNAVFLRRDMDEEKITGANLRGTAGTDNQFNCSYQLCSVDKRDTIRLAAVK